MKKSLIIASGTAVAALAASQLIKKICINSSITKEEPVDENSTDKSEEAGKNDEAKKTKNHNENAVRVNNSLISIKVKLFSK